MKWQYEDDPWNDPANKQGGDPNSIFYQNPTTREFTNINGIGALERYIQGLSGNPTTGAGGFPLLTHSTPAVTPVVTPAVTPATVGGMSLRDYLILQGVSTGGHMLERALEPTDVREPFSGDSNAQSQMDTLRSLLQRLSSYAMQGQSPSGGPRATVEDPFTPNLPTVNARRFPTAVSLQTPMPNPKRKVATTLPPSSIAPPASNAPLDERTMAALSLLRHASGMG